MTSKAELMLAPDISLLIHFVRTRRVILDADLARVYGVPTKALNQAVKRNISRFPADFMFRLNLAEGENLMRSQFVTASPDTPAADTSKRNIRHHSAPRLLALQAVIAALLYVRIHVSQAHRLGGIGVQLRVATQCLGHAFIIIESDRRQGPEQTRGEASALLLWQEQCRSRDLLNAHTNPRLMPDLWPVNWPVCARETGDSANVAAVAWV